MKYKFTVIIPVHNLEKYLEESIKSILQQNIGFKENIQLILVNDGSKDKSEKICKKYEKKYPNNIIYIYQENKGVSEARNRGISLIKGKYVNFFDGDDKWGKNAFEKVWDFFEKHYDEIDVVACRQKMFEARNEYVSLDYKFGKENEIVDINIKPDAIHASVISAFFKSEMVKKHKYDNRLRLGEDSKFLNTIILEKEKYGLLKDVTHQFRKRKDNSSATQNILEKETRYTDTVKYYYQYFYEYSMKKYGEIIPFVQFLIMNAIKYRVIQHIPKTIEEKISKKYKEDIIDIVKKTDDDVILNIKKTNIYTKIYLLRLKHGNNVLKHIKLKDEYLLFKDKKIGKFPKKNLLFIDEFNINKNKCFIKGKLRLPVLEENINLYLNSKLESKLIEKDLNRSLSKTSFNLEHIDNVYEFETQFSLNNNINYINFYLENNDYKLNLIPIFFNKDLDKLNKNYKIIDKKLVLVKNSKIIIKNKNIFRLIKHILKK